MICFALNKKKKAMYHQKQTTEINNPCGNENEIMSAIFKIIEWKKKVDNKI